MSESRETELLARVPSQLYINGQWVDGSSGRTIAVTDPATGVTIRSIADASVEDGARALDAAVAAQDSWAATAPRVRGEILRRAFDLLQERKEDFALLMTLEMGKPLAEAAARSVTAASSCGGSARKPCASAVGMGQTPRAPVTWW